MTTESDSYSQFIRIYSRVVPLEVRRRLVFRGRMIVALILLLTLVAVRFVPWWLAVLLGAGGFVTYLSMSSTFTSKTLLRYFFAERRSQGIANELVGRIGYVVIFAGPDGGSEIDPTKPKQNLRRGLDFLVDEATRYGRDVTFEEVVCPSSLLNVDWPEGAVEGSLDQEMELHLYEQAAALSCWSRADEFDGFFAVVITAWDELRAYAVPFWQRGPAHRADRELCVCSFADSPAAYAHEILHLFGARDLYLEGAESHRHGDEVREDIKRRLTEEFEVEDLEESIMGDFLGGRVHVDAATAFAVGWLDELPPERRDPVAEEWLPEEIEGDVSREERVERARKEAIQQLLPPTLFVESEERSSSRYDPSYFAKGNHWG